MSDEKMEGSGCLPHYNHIHRKYHADGGCTYFSDKCGCLSMICSICITNESTVLAAIVADKQKKLDIEKKDQVITGDVILLDYDECAILGTVSPGEYVVEDAMDNGGWMVQARQLNLRIYNPEGQFIRFHQCPGYTNSLPSIKVVGHMKRIFI